MRKWVVVAILLIVPAAFIARMSNSVNVLAQQTAYTQTISNGTGTYTNAVIVQYDPNGGTEGTAYVTEQLTGRPANWMPPGIYHSPRGTVHLNGDGYQQIGTSVPANQSPNFSHMWSFDIFTDCDQQFLDVGFCTGDGETGDLCPISGALFINFAHGMEFELAITDFFVHSGQQGFLNTACTPESSPPDFPGPFSAKDISDVDRTFRAQTGCYRFCPNPPCTGLLWTCPGAIKQSKQIPNAPLLNCTNKDKGFVTGKNVTY